VALTLVWLTESPQTSVTCADVLHARAPADGRFQGAGSCSAAACHGNIAPVRGARVLRNEHTIWISDDHHSRAYQTLHRERSKNIVINLAAGNRPEVPAHEDRRCISCHTTPRSGAELEKTPWMNEDGVSCEACHGASKAWLGPHTTTWWKNVEPKVKETTYGLVETTRLARRAEVCASCHIGRLDHEDHALIDINHDLIAAGHPRLNFEFAAYHDRMPAHWVEKGRNAARDFPAWSWAVGQVVSARTALKLLESRRATSAAQWPEFSEYDCFACHHHLADERWRRTLHPATALPGAPSWGSWYLPMTEALIGQNLAHGPAGRGQTFATRCQELSRMMSRPLPDRDKVKALVQHGIESLELELVALSQVELDGAAVERLFRQFDSPDAWSAVTNWDHAVQRYLSLVPLLQAWQRLDENQRSKQNQLRVRLQNLLEKIEFKGDFNSPRGFDPARVR
jgi:Cytochrome c554 and c-prime